MTLRYVLAQDLDLQEGALLNAESLDLVNHSLGGTSFTFPPSSIVLIQDELYQVHSGGYTGSLTTQTVEAFFTPLGAELPDAPAADTTDIEYALRVDTSGDVTWQELTTVTGGLPSSNRVEGNYLRIDSAGDPAWEETPLPVNANNRIVNINGSPIRSIGSDYIELAVFQPDTQFVFVEPGNTQSLTLSFDQPFESVAAEFQNDSLVTTVFANSYSDFTISDSGVDLSFLNIPTATDLDAFDAGSTRNDTFLPRATTSFAPIIYDGRGSAETISRTSSVATVAVSVDTNSSSFGPYTDMATVRWAQAGLTSASISTSSIRYNSTLTTASLSLAYRSSSRAGTATGTNAGGYRVDVNVFDSSSTSTPNLSLRAGSSDSVTFAFDSINPGEAIPRGNVSGNGYKPVSVTGFSDVLEFPVSSVSFSARTPTVTYQTFRFFKDDFTNPSESEILTGIHRSNYRAASSISYAGDGNLVIPNQTSAGQFWVVYPVDSVGTSKPTLRNTANNFTLDANNVTDAVEYHLGNEVSGGSDRNNYVAFGITVAPNAGEITYEFI